jgi:hypothetical protein
MMSHTHTHTQLTKHEELSDMHKQKVEEQKKKEKLEEIAEIKKAKIQEQQLNDKKKLKLERQQFYANLVSVKECVCAPVTTCTTLHTYMMDI